MTTPSARRKSKLPANLKTTGLDDDDDNNKKTTTNTTTDNNDGTINTNDLWAPQLDIWFLTGSDQIGAWPLRLDLWMSPTEQ